MPIRGAAWHCAGTFTGLAGLIRLWTFDGARCIPCGVPRIPIRGAASSCAGIFTSPRRLIGCCRFTGEWWIPSGVPNIPIGGPAWFYARIFRELGGLIWIRRAWGFRIVRHLGIHQGSRYVSGWLRSIGLRRTLYKCASVRHSWCNTRLALGWCVQRY